MPRHGPLILVGARLGDRTSPTLPERPAGAEAKPLNLLRHSNAQT